MGLLYILLWENLLVRFVSGAKVLRRAGSTRPCWARAISGSDGLPAADLPTPAAAILAAAFVIAGFAIATKPAPLVPADRCENELMTRAGRRYRVCTTPGTPVVSSTGASGRRR